jgi:hypothetical protein
LKKIDYSNPAACPACPLRSRCTTDRRRVSRLENEAVLDRMDARLKARPEILARRREIVEHPFGSIKQWMNPGAFLMKGLDNVRAEFSLTTLVYNLRRALNILGVEAMMASVRGLWNVAATARQWKAIQWAERPSGGMLISFALLVRRSGWQFPAVACRPLRQTAWRRRFYNTRM